MFLNPGINHGPLKVWSCIIRYLGIIVPLSSMVDCFWHPNCAKEAFGILLRIDNGRSRVKPLSMSSVMMSLITW